MNNTRNKVIVDKNVHLQQAIIGRSLYVLPLEWWYVAFDPSDIMFVCTEELSDPDTLSDLVLQLGLPPYNFTDVVAEGAYNVGGHRGYDTATSWEELQQEEEDGGVQGDNETDHDTSAANADHDDNDGTSTTTTPMTNGIPISQELYDEIQEFVKPYNERLFALTGKRCDW
jgi:hypothetical protein